MFFIAYKMKRLVHFMAKAELFKSPLLAYILKGIGAFPVKRGTGDIGAAKAVFRILKEGKIVGILPEGTRTRGKDPSKIKIKSGAALFAISSGVPVLPVAVSGTYKLFSKVRVVFGNPYYLKSEENKKYSAEELTIMSEDIMKRVYSLLEE
jgi:1-acyl-sn-glycerol-3-phosphate acyltransferase